MGCKSPVEQKVKVKVLQNSRVDFLQVSLAESPQRLFSSLHVPVRYPAKEAQDPSASSG